MRSFLLSLVLFLAAAHSYADEGELSVDGTFAGEMAWLNHPALQRSGASPVNDSSAFALLPRAGVGARYGLSNELEIGGGLEGAVAANVISPNARLKNASGELIAGTYGELVAPLRASYRIDSGFDLSAKLSLEMGPVLTVWANNALADPKRLDASGLPARLPLELADSWNVGGMIRLGAAFDWRLFDVFVLDVEPYVAASFAGAPALRCGVVLSPAFVLPLQ